MVRRSTGCAGCWGQGGPSLYDTATTPARAVDPLFLPHLVGERTPHLDPSMRGAWTGLDPRHDRTSLLRSALEGVAFAVADAVDALPLTAARGRETRLAGGGTTHAAWRTLLATVLDRPLHAVEVPAASARGAGLLAARAADLLDDAGLLAAARVPSHPVADPEPAAADLLARRRARWTTTLLALRVQARPDDEETDRAG
ncbi:hypothetical protein GCM10025868_01430 [Angustibacter aerolatus]|uniref:Carbohydrate kinase FGGY C-terminal domain-containing protein n=1 Tax=Angustibacter aerolatus TaxID=1162965 RepID=A0ABQ6J9R3_9ACTN|nr:hypothetical protein GCM10025868_01430 [Angustibacter aerolatus]